MSWTDYWGALTAGQRARLVTGAVLIAVAAVGVSVWLLRDPYVPLASGLTGEQINAALQDLDRAKVKYRLADSGDRLTVPQSQLGKARAAMEAGDAVTMPSVGLELFKDTDFSTTDFAQRINYQRALQGELTRTIQTIAGVRRARVHVILADAGLFKRDNAKASAAVTVALDPGKVLTQPQVRGIQRLVAASVPEIRLDDVVVLDESGTSLTRAGGTGESEASATQLDLKRQVDQYLESKLLRLLQDLVPQGTASLSVDAVLDERQLRVTTDEPLATSRGSATERASGVVVKDRRSQHGHTPGLMQAAGNDADDDSTDSEHEYVVGHRMEQTLTNPGAIRRVSVAVALRGAPAGMSISVVEQLVVNAVGIDRSRGDAVTVLLLPGEAAATSASATAPSVTGAAQASGGNPVSAAAGQDSSASAERRQFAMLIGLLILALVGGALLIVSMLRGGRPGTVAGTPKQSDIDIAATATKIRQWLEQGAASGHS